MLSGLSGFAGAQFDFAAAAPLRKSYIIAAPYRSGSNYLCTLLWRTGVLGAPFGYLNFENEMRILYSRLGATSMADYIAKLIEKRTSGNGVFAIKSHFHHFAGMCRQHPQLLNQLQPVQFVLLERSDKIAQAVSLAKGYQTRAWLSIGEERRTPLFYSREFVQRCLDEILEQQGQWESWLAKRKLEYLRLKYEEIIADPAAAVAQVAEFLGASADQSAEVHLPVLRKQSDQVNVEWIARFEEDTRGSGADETDRTAAAAQLSTIGPSMSE